MKYINTSSLLLFHVGNCCRRHWETAQSHIGDSQNWLGPDAMQQAVRRYPQHKPIIHLNLDRQFQSHNISSLWNCKIHLIPPGIPERGCPLRAHTYTPVSVPPSSFAPPPVNLIMDISHIVASDVAMDFLISIPLPIPSTSTSPAAPHSHPHPVFSLLPSPVCCPSPCQFKSLCAVHQKSNPGGWQTAKP